MVTVAVAGGTGGVGKTIVEAIQAAGQNHQVVILSRKIQHIRARASITLRYSCEHTDTSNQAPTDAKASAVPVIAVDYTSIDAVQKALEANNVHTVISALTSLPQDGSDPEMTLIQAADASTVTKRMITSNWGIPVEKKIAETIPLAAGKARNFEALQQAKNLQGSAVYNGYFLDYYCFDSVKSYMSPASVVLDMVNGAATIPGDGNQPVVFTHTTDVAKYVAAALDLESWDSQLFVIGDKLTWNEMLQLAEAGQGRKFNVVYDDLAKLQSGQVSELPSHIPLYQWMPKEVLQGLFATFGCWFAQGWFDLKPAKTLNQSFPDIAPRKAKDVVGKGATQ